MADKSERYYKSVAKFTEDSHDVVIPDGETWTLQEWTASISDNRKTFATVVWDYQGGSEEIITVAYSSTSSEQIGMDITGDGIKKLSIVLVNDSSNDEIIGASFCARMG